MQVENGRKEQESKIEKNLIEKMFKNFQSKSNA